jgi:hypothetical protein
VSKGPIASYGSKEVQSVPVVPKGPNGSQIPEKEPKKIRIPEDIPTTKTDLTNQTTQRLALRLTLMATETRTIRETSASEIPIATKEESHSV